MPLDAAEMYEVLSTMVGSRWYSLRDNLPCDRRVWVRMLLGYYREMDAQSQDRLLRKWGIDA